MRSRLVQRLAVHGLIVGALTALTQVGGLAYLASLALLRPVRRLRRARRWRRAAAVLGLAALLYAGLTAAVVPPTAAAFGRVRLPCGHAEGRAVTTLPLTCALNRGYVRPEVRDLLTDLGAAMARRYPGNAVTVLDAGFPFIDGFPLLPHLSHDDARKVDLAFFYRSRAGGEPIPHGSPSPVGYFLYEPPHAGEHTPCAERWSPLRWDFAWLQPENPAWVLDAERTAAMLDWLKAQPSVARMFLEPHLADRLAVAGGKLRFQGCWAARHDDHIHVEVR